MVLKKIEERSTTGGGRILFMDDDVMIQDIACAMLEMLGYEIEVAAHGKEAVERFRQARESGRPFDAVILDLTIPGGMGGEAVIKYLQDMDKDVKAIVSSGYSGDPVTANYRDYGFSAVMIKPYNLQKMREVLQDVLGKKK